ncbi:hypothetical protein Emed_006173 [Eimeria media]
MARMRRRREAMCVGDKPPAPCCPAPSPPVAPASPAAASAPAAAGSTSEGAPNPFAAATASLTAPIKPARELQIHPTSSSDIAPETDEIGCLYTIWWFEGRRRHLAFSGFLLLYFCSVFLIPSAYQQQQQLLKEQQQQQQQQQQRSPAPGRSVRPPSVKAAAARLQQRLYFSCLLLLSIFQGSLLCDTPAQLQQRATLAAAGAATATAAAETFP